MIRGEIWSAATGSGFGSKPRPVLVLQSELFIDAPRIIVALFTSELDEDQLVRPRIDPDSQNNLTDVSLVQIDILVTVRRVKFGRRIGRLSDFDQSRVDQAVLTYLGFGS